MAKRFVDSRKFQDPWYRSLPVEYKCFWDYILCSCDHAGVWKVDMPLAEFCIGSSINVDTARKLFSNRIVDIPEEKWFIPKFLTFQYQNLNEFSNLYFSIKNILLGVGIDEEKIKGYLTLAKGLGKGCQTLKDKNKDKNNNNKGVVKGGYPQDFVATIKTNPAYKHINIDIELSKMDAWLTLPKNKGRKKTPQFILNWLNKIEAPIITKPLKREFPTPIRTGPIATPEEVRTNLKKARELVEGAAQKVGVA